MNNFLNTFYSPSKNTIVLGTLSNHEPNSKYVVYCEPECIPISYLKKFLEGGYKNYLSFRTKRTLKKKVNLFLIFSILTKYENKMNAQKYFFPYYENIVLKTKYWNVLSLSDFVKQLNIIYETTEPFTPDLDFDNLEQFKQFIVDDCGCSDLKVEINYDLHYHESIRFVFQYHFY